jgi:uncharacterized protein YkwD
MFLLGWTAILLTIATSVWGLGEAGYDYKARAEQEILQLINQARRQRGLPQLDENAQLREAARSHARLMASNQTLSHQLAGEPILRKRLALAGVHFHTDGETVAFDESPEAAQQSLMQSPPHRAIILDPEYNAVGVGIVERNGTVWVTEDFARLR